MAIKFNTSCEVSAVDIVSSATDDDIITFIKSIDKLTADWEFTERLYKYFKTEMAKKAKEDKENGKG